VSLVSRYKPWRRFGRCATVIVLATVGCSPGASLFGGSPESTVTRFYDQLNKGEYSKAKSLLTADARQLVDGPLMVLAGGFANFAEQETKRGTIREVKILSSVARGEGATVQYQVVFKDGSIETKSNSLSKEDGSWKMGIAP
jgi:hypothetical protein